jgi:hypothetical protein
MPLSTPSLSPFLVPLLASFLSIAVAAFTLGAVCNGAATGDAPGLRQVRGQIIEVAARSIGEVETLRLRDDSGQEYVFTTQGFIGFTPSHLLEHRLLGQPVLVTYREENGRLIAVKTED